MSEYGYRRIKKSHYYVKGVGRHPEQIDITHILKPHRENLLAVRVDPYRVEHVSHHMSSDPWAGWYAGLMDIELTTGVYVDDVFAYTVDIGDPAHMRLEVNAGSDNGRSFSGQLITRVHPWYPGASGSPAGQSSQVYH